METEVFSSARASRGNTPTSEEEDLLDRSTKKPKPNEANCNEVIMDDEVSEGGEGRGHSTGHQGKPSYHEVVMLADGYNPGAKEIIKMVEEELCPFLEEELKAKDAVKEFVMRPIIEVTHEDWYKPWKNALIVNPADAHPEMAVPEGSMVVAHQTTTEDGKQDPQNDIYVHSFDHSSTLETNGSKPKRNLGPNAFTKPKSAKLNSSLPNRQNKGQVVKPKGNLTSSVPSPLPSTNTPMGSDKELMRKKEEEILRIMSWKQKEMWNAYVAGKSSDEVLNQFVHTPSDELVALANSLRTGQRRGDELQPDPPDPASIVACKIDDTPISPSGPANDFALVIDEATCSTV
ncbi:hypothetical protein RIF29_20452 [Crotalaria pallida]|uniref:Uncharacterized protein n=1 Tax=Crotalaria pallida TaxID=3830 RepID=A0AAN9I523_CROPI